ncbi:MAG TPA: tripartite tricarboxylate transporter substrate binding protein, partial [Burkholderiales bacterium]|nr:tripartite tricarboxylate transporter substrate binding protein [Burkholderiales bacterium]
LASSVAAQDTYPSKPIRILVGYAAGGGNDIIVRVMQPEMQKGLGQSVIVENRPGAQGIIAADLAAKAAADGYTIMMGPSGPMTINPATYSKLSYDPVRDFAPIAMICSFPLIVTVDPKLPIHSVKELIAYAKANPGKSNYGSSAGIFQITTEMFKQRTGTAIEMINYKSSGESVQAVISGQVMMTIVDPPPAAGPLKAGTLRGLAVTSAARHPSWPELPTLIEAGVPDMEVPVWTAFFAPAKTPPAIVARLQKEVARVVQTAEVKERFAQMGLDPVGGSSEDLRRRVASDITKWTAVAKAANIKND